MRLGDASENISALRDPTRKPKLEAGLRSVE